jgi:hypothetical protein
MTDQQQPEKQPEKQITAAEEVAEQSVSQPQTDAVPKPAPEPVVTADPKPAAEPAADVPKPPAAAPPPASPAVPEQPKAAEAPPTPPAKDETQADPRSALASPAEAPKPSPLVSPAEAPKPSTAPVASSGTICPTCSHRNRPGILICENCGTNLASGRQIAVGTRDLKREDENAASEGKAILDTGQAKAIESAGAGTFNENMLLRVEIEGGAAPMLVYPKQEIIMGRRDPNTGGMPDVDLTAYAGYRMGVSRRHAAIRLQDKQLHVSDLGSSNGTFLNGVRLVAHRPYQLRDGDEIRLGQMVLRLFFQTNRK